MTPERWKRIEELFHAARVRPTGDRSAFLANACADDDRLRRNVESLLAESESPDDFLAGAVVSIPAQLIADFVPAAMTGVTLGGYHLQMLLGAGGMGEVYRAHDSTLGRDVAIKILSRALISDPARLARFEGEARMLAALNHPNICAIHGFEEADGIRFLILELVDGETLAETLANVPAERSEHAGLPVPDALAIARQIAEALEAAHEKGIVHRDLKPANIKITSAGTVKVLDFGLAKATAIAPATAGNQTSDGLVLGTAAYMSPEQARGKAVDKRADIWAFGCVLYEMLTGRGIFAGETVSDTIGKILEREPDWSALPVATPTSVRRLLRRCLVKDPKQRLRDIGEARIDIDAVEDSSPNAGAVTVPRRGSLRAVTWLPWLLVATLAAVIGVSEVRRPAILPDDPLANATFTRFTDWEGTEGGAEISPDGKFVAFIADRDGQLNLWVSQVGTGHFLNLTKDIPPLSAPGGILRILGFSGDGGEIWFTQAGDSSAPKWLIPLSGGTPRAFLGQGNAAPSWSPDDTRLVYFRNSGGDPLFIADRTSADSRPIVVDTKGFFASGVHNHNPVWSQDGQWIYFAHGPEPTEEMNVWRVRPSGGTPEQLTTLRAAANHLAPIDPRTLLYVARAEDGSGPWLWSLDVETKVTRRVTSGLEHYSSVSASRNGRRVMATVSNSTANLWRVPLLDRQAEDRDVQPYTLPSARALSPRFGRTSLFYLSGRGAGDGLWRFQDGNSFEVWKAASDSLSEPPAVSPDGARVAIIVRQEGKRRLLIMSADGTNARTLASSITIETSGGHGSADWSPDGSWIVIAGTDVQGSGLFKIPVDGGAPVRLVSGQVLNPVWSPDGALIVYGGPSVGGQVSLLGVRPDGSRVELPDVRTGLGAAHRFLPNGTGLVYSPRSQSRDFWLLDLNTKKTQPLTHLSDHGVLSAFDITSDGKEIVFDRSRENSDIVLIDLPK
jgi:Tol biopolymer transport system component/tRNA A-37 threonylcarbamoyl transferase component Bud32